MEYEPLPSAEDLALLESAIGSPLGFDRRIRGGQSATTDVLSTTDGRRVVLRRHGRWAVGFDDGIADRESAVLRAAKAGGVPVPRVLWSGRLGATTAIITEYIEGAATLQPEDPLQWSAQLAATLASVHAIRIASPLASVLGGAPPSPVDLEPSPVFATHPHGQALLAQRKALAPTIGLETCLVHGDYWPGNLLWHEDEIVAVLDWEAAVLGDPASDVAYCLAEMRYTGLEKAADHFVATYRRLTGADLTSLPYWLVTALCRAVPELDSYLDGWAPLGYRPDPAVVHDRLDRFIEESLDY